MKALVSGICLLAVAFAQQNVPVAIKEKKYHIEKVADSFDHPEGFDPSKSPFHFSHVRDLSFKPLVAESTLRSEYSTARKIQSQPSLQSTYEDVSETSRPQFTAQAQKVVEVETADPDVEAYATAEALNDFGSTAFLKKPVSIIQQTTFHQKTFPSSSFKQSSSFRSSGYGLKNGFSASGPQGTVTSFGTPVVTSYVTTPGVSSFKAYEESTSAGGRSFGLSGQLSQGEEYRKQTFGAAAPTTYEQSSANLETLQGHRFGPPSFAYRKQVVSTTGGQTVLTAPAVSTYKTTEQTSTSGFGGSGAAFQQTAKSPTSTNYQQSSASLQAAQSSSFGTPATSASLKQTTAGGFSFPTQTSYKAAEDESSFTGFAQAAPATTYRKEVLTTTGGASFLGDSTATPYKTFQQTSSTELSGYDSAATLRSQTKQGYSGTPTISTELIAPSDSSSQKTVEGASTIQFGKQQGLFGTGTAYQTEYTPRDFTSGKNTDFGQYASVKNTEYSPVTATGLKTIVDISADGVAITGRNVASGNKPSIPVGLEQIYKSQSAFESSAQSGSRSAIGFGTLPGTRTAKTQTTYTTSAQPSYGSTSRFESTSVNGERGLTDSSTSGSESSSFYSTGSTTGAIRPFGTQTTYQSGSVSGQGSSSSLPGGQTTYQSDSVSGQGYAGSRSLSSFDTGSSLTRSSLTQVPSTLTASTTISGFGSSNQGSSSVDSGRSFSTGGQSSETTSSLTGSIIGSSDSSAGGRSLQNRIQTSVTGTQLGLTSGFVSGSAHGSSRLSSSSGPSGSFGFGSRLSTADTSGGRSLLSGGAPSLAAYDSSLSLSQGSSETTSSVTSGKSSLRSSSTVTAYQSPSTLTGSTLGTSTSTIGGSSLLSGSQTSTTGTELGVGIGATTSGRSTYSSLTDSRSSSSAQSGFNAKSNLQEGASESTEGRSTILKNVKKHGGSGLYEFSYETSNGINHDEAGAVKNLGTQDENAAITGSYSYVGNDGVTYTVQYIADEEGFRAFGDHIPKLPEDVRKALEEGEKDAHLYDEEGRLKAPTSRF